MSETDRAHELPPEAVEAAIGPLLSDERRARIEQVLDGRTAEVTVVIEEVSDPHNAAAAVRSCEAFGLSELHVIEGEAPTPGGARLHKGVMLPPARFRPSGRVAQGAERWLSVEVGRDVAACLGALRERGFRCLAALPDASESLAEMDLAGPVAFVLGNEHRGLSERARALCHGSYRIPTSGMTRSLNLSVSVALTVYHAVVVRGPRAPLSPEARARLRARWYLEEIPSAPAIVRRYLAERR